MGGLCGDLLAGCLFGVVGFGEPADVVGVDEDSAALLAVVVGPFRGAEFAGYLDHLAFGEVLEVGFGSSPGFDRDEVGSFVGASVAGDPELAYLLAVGCFLEAWRLGEASECCGVDHGVFLLVWGPCVGLDVNEWRRRAKPETQLTTGGRANSFFGPRSRS